MNASFEEPAIPPRLRRPLAAAWISLGLHAAVIALVQVAPPRPASVDAPAIEARLVSAGVAPPTAEPMAPAPEKTPQNAPQRKEGPQPMPRAVPLPPPDDAPVDTPEPVIAQPAAVAPPAEPEPDTAAGVPPAAVSAPPVEATPPAPPAASTPPAAIISAVDPIYYSARELDTQPRALDEIVPDYPAGADRERVSGKVRLQLRLEADGRISDIDIIASTPSGVFDKATIDAFREVRFSPARRGGRPVRAQVLIEVVYDWEGRFR